jgi:hypothetical protein
VSKTKEGWGQKKIKSKGRKIMRKDVDEEVQNCDCQKRIGFCNPDLVPIIGTEEEILVL